MTEVLRPQPRALTVYLKHLGFTPRGYDEDGQGIWEVNLASFFTDLFARATPVRPGDTVH